jgi:hypothetical protein
MHRQNKKAGGHSKALHRQHLGASNKHAPQTVAGNGRIALLLRAMVYGGITDKP